MPLDVNKSTRLVPVADAKLEPFGSSCNGFGFRESDLDLCLTFTELDPKVKSLSYVLVGTMSKINIKFPEHRVHPVHPSRGLTFRY